MIRKDSLHKLFHISSKIHGRDIPLHPVYCPDENQGYIPDWADEPRNWYMWVEQEGKIECLRGYPAQSHYFGRGPEHQDDIYFRFNNMITQYLCYNSILEPLGRIFEDIHNLGASISKLGLYEKLPKAHNTGRSRMITSEVEYIFSVCRSMYDLFQEIIANVWNLIGVDGGNQLPPTSFSSIALHGDQPVSSENLEKDYGLLTSIAEFYENEAETFSKIRDFRDNILHHGETVRLIFITDEGYAVRSDFEPFSTFDVWNEDDFLENDLAPFWPPIAFVINHTIGVLDRFLSKLQLEVAFLPPLAPEYVVFTRGDFMKNIGHLPSLIEDDVWGKRVSEMLSDTFVETDITL
ncbi:hypothetical protein [Halococcus sp. PRR34]|uniref:hypothetical protein n=1 Tax=Halococcus sp. PRR34 TaxID=3020830 RepID=UPI0023621C15|nr:hypothetical protein [Halococcus sp. PRR34]